VATSRPKPKAKPKPSTPPLASVARAETPATPTSAAPAPEKRSGGRHTLLTDELQQKIVSFIRAGAWDWVVAEANGVDRFTFWEWIRRGEGEDPDRSQTERYAQFAQAVREARAQARTVAEVKVHDTEPVKYLMSGPGRDRPGGAPGWTNGDGQAERRMAEAISASPAATLALNTILDAAFPQDNRTDEAAGAGGT